MKIVLVDDHILIAKALASIIESFHEYEVLYECANGKELQERMQTAMPKPDIVLVDINMPVMNGFETTTWLKENHPDIKVLCLSMLDDEQSLLKMIDAGVNGYVLKNSNPAQLQQALKGIVDNGTFFPAWATQQIVKSLRKENRNNPVNSPKITKREMEFLRLCATELSYKEMAAQMNCSPRTVETYRDALMQKLDVKGRVGLAIYALKAGLTA